MAPQGVLLVRTLGLCSRHCECFFSHVDYEASKPSILGTVFHLQRVLKDLFFGVDLGGIGVTHCFRIILNPLGYLG